MAMNRRDLYWSTSIYSLISVLGKSAVLTTAQGLKIACVGGIYDEAAYAVDSEAVSIFSIQ